MPCYELKGPRPGFICGFHPVYRFDGWLFEVPSYGGPCPLNKDGSPRATPPGRKFWKMWGVFAALPEDARRALLERGGSDGTDTIESHEEA